MDNEERKRLLVKIRGLQLKTVENGCSEAEALSAAAKAMELLTKYGLEQTEVDVKTATHRVWTINIGVPPSNKVCHPIQFVLMAVGAATDTKVWLSKIESERVVRFFGEEQDVRVADYLVGLLRGAMDHEWDQHKAWASRSGVFAHKPSFHSGMAGRLHERLMEMSNAKRQKLEAGASRALVPLKRQMVEQAFHDQVGIKLRKKTSTIGHRDSGSLMAGRQAGDRVAFNRALGN